MGFGNLTCLHVAWKWFRRAQVRFYRGRDGMFVSFICLFILSQLKKIFHHYDIRYLFDDRKWSFGVTSDVCNFKDRLTLYIIFFNINSLEPKNLFDYRLLSQLMDDLLYKRAVENSVNIFKNQNWSIDYLIGCSWRSLGWIKDNGWRIVLVIRPS